MTNEQSNSEEEFSNIDTIECPNCGHEAMVEIVHGTGEENIQCHNCGYSRRLAMTNGSFELKEFPGYGAYRVEMLGAHRIEAGSFTHKGAAVEFENLMKQIQQNVAYASYSQYINGEIVTKVVIDKNK